MTTAPDMANYEPRAPETIDEPPISPESAARLMDRVGFVVFRPLTDGSLPDSCLMVLLHDTPTRRHFDADRISYWSFDKGHGQLLELDRSVEVPFSRAYSWGRIRIVDRFGARNSFVSFGGTLTGARVGPGARLLIFRSPTTILRLAGHSQREDRLSEEAVAFFAELIPHLWTDDRERIVAELPPRDLYAAFLLQLKARIDRSAKLREALADDRRSLRTELELLAASDSQSLRAGERLLGILNLAAP
jgi:hypothetical protein